MFIRQTRDHDDLDLDVAVPHKYAPRLRALPAERVTQNRHYVNVEFCGGARPRRAASTLVSMPGLLFLSPEARASRRVSTRHARVRAPHHGQDLQRTTLAARRWLGVQFRFGRRTRLPPRKLSGALYLTGVAGEISQR
jgi:hypothetical protein